MSSPAKSADEPRQFRFSLRGIFMVMLALAIPLAAYGWFYRQIQAPSIYSNRIEQKIRSLVQRRPADMTRGQWGSAVAWTLNLHGNSLVRFEADYSSIKAFDRRLEEKLRGDVDMSTIHWIWDEYAKLTPHGASYQRFKEMMQEEIDGVGPNTDVWNMKVP